MHRSQVMTHLLVSDRCVCILSVILAAETTSFCKAPHRLQKNTENSFCKLGYRWAWAVRGRVRGRGGMMPPPHWSQAAILLISHILASERSAPCPKSRLSCWPTRKHTKG
ncbi:hypothetical protein NSPZN2_100376 [Nitrospira defluvii]|uniref:Secreted protein n=1 Tax=Nitrospira defluvii TaxID=330214 RepID=A0ABM8R3R9_9BACT|nr:hypothetical protein NSPZN2_100376 [Nitrospira defluvii]